MLSEEITKLKKRLIEYAGLVENMIDKSVSGLTEKNEALLREVAEKDEPKANQFEIELEEQCMILIAKYQPRAKDLRIILRIDQMNNDLERMGDQAVNIVESSLFLIQHPQLKPLIDIPKMGEIAIQMVKDSIDAFVREDAALAKDVCERDQVIDDLKDQIQRELFTYIASKPSSIERAFHLIRIANNLERVGDLSTNICEDVIFIVNGRVVKHHHDED
jgi:phosphate transport system protein